MVILISEMEMAIRMVVRTLVHIMVMEMDSIIKEIKMVMQMETKTKELPMEM